MQQLPTGLCFKGCCDVNFLFFALVCLNISSYWLFSVDWYAVGYSNRNSASFWWSLDGLSVIPVMVVFTSLFLVIVYQQLQGHCAVGQNFVTWQVAELTVLQRWCLIAVRSSSCCTNMMMMMIIIIINLLAEHDQLKRLFIVLQHYPKFTY